MEFSIDIHTELNGEITIEDYSREYKQYIDEDVPVVSSYDLYKYSECVTLNTITKVNVCEITLIDVLLNEHTEELDTCTFKVKDDGFYVIDHIILPNLLWLQNSSDEYKQYYETIYVTDGSKIYKQVNGELQECTIKEIMERNTEGTTIKKCKVDVFFTGNLQQCYIDYCKRIFNDLLTKCPTSTPDTYARDFLWMTLNIIDYLVGFKQFMEAQRILEVVNTCNGFCTVSHKYLNNRSCGCAKV